MLRLAVHSSLLALSLLVGLATSVWAADGRLEINQTCAVQTGCWFRWLSGS